MLIHRTRGFAIAIASIAALGSAGCSAGPDPIAFQNRVFYQYDQLALHDTSAFEQRYPRLDLELRAPNPEYIGVTVIGGSIHLSRPKNWVIRTASNKPEERFIEYVSPNEYIFAIYERVDSPDDLWRDVMDRYESDAKKAGAEIIGNGRAPMSTWNAQGRAYVMRRQVKAAKEPFMNTSYEFLARSEHRIVLVQIVHQTASIQPVNDELMRVVQTMEIN